MLACGVSVMWGPGSYLFQTCAQALYSKHIFGGEPPPAANGETHYVEVLYISDFLDHGPGAIHPTQVYTVPLQEIRTVMLVNCGACENLRELLPLTANTRAVVIDSHRPIHHRCDSDLDTVIEHRCSSTLTVINSASILCCAVHIEIDGNPTQLILQDIGPLC